MALSKSVLLLTFLILAKLLMLQSQGELLIVINPPKTYQCLNISEIEMCSNIGYSMASFPNWRDQPNPLEAHQEISQYLPVIQTVCSEAIVHMLCAVYAPFCDPTHPHIRLPPCKELCQEVRDGCEDVMQGFGYPWPPPLDCSKYPSFQQTRLVFCTDNIDDLLIPSNVPGVERTGIQSVISFPCQ